MIVGVQQLRRRRVRTGVVDERRTNVNLLRDRMRQVSLAAASLSYEEKGMLRPHRDIDRELVRDGQDA